MKKVHEQFSRRTRNIKIATLYFKRGPQNDGGGPDFCLRETDKWIIFPHEIVGLSKKELKKKEKYIQKLL